MICKGFRVLKSLKKVRDLFPLDGADGLGKYKIETADDLAGRKQYADNQIQVLTDQRKELRNALKRITRKGDAAEIEATKEKISALTDELIKLRKEVKLCDSIAERSGLVKEGLEAIIEQDTSERKEKNQYEHSRRRSGTDRQNSGQMVLIF